MSPLTFVVSRNLRLGARDLLLSERRDKARFEHGLLASNHYWRDKMIDELESDKLAPFSSAQSARLIFLCSSAGGGARHEVYHLHTGGERTVSPCESVGDGVSRE